MKLAFIVQNEYVTPQVMQLLKAAGIDYYTRWDRAYGKGHGTDPHLGAGSFGTTNSVLMIAFREQEPLEALLREIESVNSTMKRRDDQIRVFLTPLDRIV